MATRAPVYVALDEGERAMLLRMLNRAANETEHARQWESQAGEGTSELEREATQIDVMYERIADDGVPLTRADMLQALRLAGRIIPDGWTPEDVAEARRVYAVLKARCTNALRKVRQRG